VHLPHRTTTARLIVPLGEHGVDVLLGLADVLARKARQVDTHDVDAELARDCERSQRLPRTGRTVEQRYTAPGLDKLAQHLVHGSILRRLSRSGVCECDFRRDNLQANRLCTGDDWNPSAFPILKMQAPIFRQCRE
jgi:hypothetical protein